MDRLTRWNALPAAEAEREVLDCCHSPVWARAVVAGRPYPSVVAVRAAADSALAALTWADLRPALDAHPRIGARVAAAGRGGDWSRREQAGAQGADEGTAAALVEANQRYEERFGHVFLIFASGRGAVELLAAARARLGHDEATERAVVRAELGKITARRLERMLGETT